MTRLHTWLTARGGGVVGLSVYSFGDDADGRQRLGTAARSLGMGYPTGLAAPSIASRFRVSALPTTVVIDTQGQVAATFVGSVSEARLHATIEPLLP